MSAPSLSSTTSSTSVTIRLPKDLLARLQALAKVNNTRYQTLIKQLLYTAVERLEGQSKKEELTGSPEPIEEPQGGVFKNPDKVLEDLLATV